MSSSKVMIIRHAEGPIDGRVEGVRARGRADAASLTTLGWQRAGALVSFFRSPSSPHIACPDHLLAVRFDLANAESSRRSGQTLRPLSQALGVPVDDRFGEGQESQLARSLPRLAGTILIAWSHENIPKIAAAMGFASTAPQEWPDERFDLVWVFEQVRRKATFTQVPQLLLAGDSPSVIPLAETQT